MAARSSGLGPCSPHGPRREHLGVARCQDEQEARGGAQFVAHTQSTAGWRELADVRLSSHLLLVPMSMLQAAAATCFCTHHTLRMLCPPFSNTHKLTPCQVLWVVLEEQVHRVPQLEHSMGVVDPAVGSCDVEGWTQRLPRVSSEVVTACPRVVCQVWGGTSNCRAATGPATECVVVVKCSCVWCTQGNSCCGASAW